jgi:hypothetical protein
MRGRGFCTVRSSASEPALVDSLTANHRANDLHVLDLVGRNRVRVFRQNDIVSQSARRGRPFDVLLMRVMGAVDRAMRGSNGPGLKSEPAATCTPASRRLRNAIDRFMKSSPAYVFRRQWLPRARRRDRVRATGVGRERRMLRSLPGRMQLLVAERPNFVALRDEADLPSAVYGPVLA